MYSVLGTQPFNFLIVYLWTFFVNVAVFGIYTINKILIALQSVAINFHANKMYFTFLCR